MVAEVTGRAVTKRQRLKVVLGHTPNRDIPEGYWDGIIPDENAVWVPVSSLAEASDACQKWIETWNLGAGNWVGGTVQDRWGKEIARVSYNGRIWTVA